MLGMDFGLAIMMRNEAVFFRAIIPVPVNVVPPGSVETLAINGAPLAAVFAYQLPVFGYDISYPGKANSLPLLIPLGNLRSSSP